MFEKVKQFGKNAVQFVKNTAVKACAMVAGAAASMKLLATDAHAALSPADEALITAGISSSDATYYKLAGSLIVVIAGIWGVKKVIGLLSGGR